MLRRKCMFGEIEVRDEPAERALYLNGQKQGGAYFRPSADEVNDALPAGEPGPVCSSAYALGWIVAGLMNPTGTGLMIGLGSGAGATQLLYSVPMVDLVIVEIDPVMVQVALDEFPLLNYYMDRGRLSIEIEDIDDFLVRNNDTWDFALADAYDSGQEVIDDHIETLCERSPHIYVNIIDRLMGISMQRIAMMMESKGTSVVEIFKTVPLAYSSMGFRERSNWILTNQVPDMARLAEYPIYPYFDDIHAHDTRMAWDLMLANTLSEVV